MSIVFLNTSFYQDPDARNKINKFLSNRLPLKKRPIWTLMEETKPHVTQKNEFESRDGAKLKAILGNCGLSRF